MWRMNLNLGKFQWANLVKLAAVALLLAGGFPAGSGAQQKGQKTFSSPEEASDALLAATKSNDEKAMIEIFGGMQSDEGSAHAGRSRPRKPK